MIISILIPMISGIITSLVVIFVWEWFQRPELFVEYDNNSPYGIFYRMNVNNYGGKPAYNCKIKMKFMNTQRMSIFNNKINGKWDSKPALNIQRDLRIFYVHYIEKTDIYNNIPDSFSLITRENNSVYAFSSWNGIHFNHGIDIDDEWLLNNGNYIVDIELISERTNIFRFKLTINMDNIQIEKYKICDCIRDFINCIIN